MVTPFVGDFLSFHFFGFPEWFVGDDRRERAFGAIPRIRDARSSCNGLHPQDGRNKLSSTCRLTMPMRSYAEADTNQEKHP